MIALYNKFLYNRYDYKVMTVWTLLDMARVTFKDPRLQHILFVTTAGHLLALRTWASKQLDNMLQFTTTVW